jgi:acyl carrier protein
MYDLVEPRVRHVVADHLGVDSDDLRPEISLVDDLAADSLDLVEVAMALESELGIEMSERQLQRVRTYADLVEATVALAQRRGRREAARADGQTVVRAEVMPAGQAQVTLARSGRLTPYTLETIAEDALRGGEGARLDITAAAGTPDEHLAWIRDQFGWLGHRGVEVRVRRAPRSTASPTAHSDAAA